MFKRWCDLAPRPVEPNIQAYVLGIKPLVAKAFGSTTFYLELEQHRRAQIPKLGWAESDFVRKVYRDILKEYGSAEELLGRCQLQRWKRQLTPLLITPAVLDRRLELNAPDVLKTLLKRSPQSRQIGQVLDRSQLCADDWNFRTDLFDKQPTIFGNAHPIFKSVTSLAHELGHVWAETAGSVSQNESLTGEMLALELEEEAGQMLASSAQDKAEWEDYCRSVDYLNLAFFLLEAKEAFGDDVRSDSVQGFYPPSLVLRQTYFCSPGYQLIYAMASLRRLRRRRPSHSSNST